MRSHQELAAGTAVPAPLLDEDLRALRASYNDLSDIPASVRDSIDQRFRHASEVARRVSDGTQNPLST